MKSEIKKTHNLALYQHPKVYSISFVCITMYIFLLQKKKGSVPVYICILYTYQYNSARFFSRE